jgi:hypothetical protein
MYRAELKRKIVAEQFQDSERFRRNAAVTTGLATEQCAFKKVARTGSFAKKSDRYPLQIAAVILSFPQRSLRIVPPPGI